MIKEILSKFGYVKSSDVKGFRDLSKNPFREEELSLMLAELLKDADEDIPEEEEVRMFKELKEVEGFLEYLRRAAVKDTIRYFGAVTPQEQFVIRGAFARTNFIKSKIQNIVKDKKSGLSGVRYG